MAVTSKISKLSNLLLWVIVSVSMVVFGFGFLGGEAPESTIERSVPKYLDFVIYWDYVVFGAAIVGFLLFLIYQFVINFLDKPKSAIVSLGVLVGFIALMVICYAAGSTTPVPVNPELAEFNSPFWLKTIDMWIFSLSIMMGICLLACLAGAIKQVIDK
jgi:hypothetical protein